MKRNLTLKERSHRAAREANASLDRLNASLRQRSTALSAAHRQIKKEVGQRKAAEKSLSRSEAHYSALLQQSRLMQEQLRHLSHQLLSAQEEERKTISRDLHDEITQTLTGITVQLATLKAAATVDSRDLQKKVSTTQRMVENSVRIVHRFARELRPSVLDDLGLIPALHAFVKNFARQTQLPVKLRIFAGVEKLNAEKRTVLYRVVQESLTNVARHARASHVDICIEERSSAVVMKIKDDGRSFSVQRTLHGIKQNRLGLLGMRERVEMVGGRFHIESSPGQGTTIEVQIPIQALATGKKSPSPRRAHA